MPSLLFVNQLPATVNGPLRVTEARRKAAVRSRWAASEALTPRSTCWAVMRPAGHGKVAIVRQDPAVVEAIAKVKTALATGGTLRCTAQAHTGRSRGGGGVQPEDGGGVMTTSSFSTNGSTNGVHHATDEAIDTLYAWMPGLSPAPQPCPEARFSLTLTGTLDGQEAVLTARGQTAAEFTANLEAIKGVLDPVPAQASSPQGQPSQNQLTQAQHNAAAQHKRVSGFCKVHNVAMKWNEGKEGRKGWYSHRTDDGWCKGR